MCYFFVFAHTNTINPTEYITQMHQAVKRKTSIIYEIGHKQAAHKWLNHKQYPAKHMMFKACPSYPGNEATDVMECDNME